MGRSTQYYKTHPKARKKKAETTSKISRTEKDKAKRRELAKKRYAAKKAGKNIKGKDYDHAVGKFVKASTNRGRKGEGGRKKGVPHKKK